MVDSTRNRVVIVTGVSRGLGEALAVDLLGRGCSVIGVGRSDSDRLRHERYRFVACDLSGATAIDAALAQVFHDLAQKQWDAICLVNNAATAAPAGVIGHLAAAELASSLALNLTAPLVLANLFCRTFVDTTVERRIVNVSSGAAQSAITGGGPYSIAKAGLEMLTQQLTAEHTDASFRAITIRPGIIDTGMQTFMRSRSATELPSVGMFRDFHQSGRLVVVARRSLRPRSSTCSCCATLERGPGTYSYKEL